MNTDEVVIDLAKLGRKVFVGRRRGEQARQSFGLDRADKQGRKVRVRIPNSVYSVNSSYFLGMFGKSVQACGSRKAFFDRYIFDAPDWIWPKIEDGVLRALHQKKDLFDY